MKRNLFLVSLYLSIATAFADTKVETFTTHDGSNTKTYETSPVFKTCDQATWTVFRGGITQNQGNMGADNFVALIRGTKPTETGYGYLISDSIEGGIDSLWFDWNSNGDKTSHNRDWKIKISINGDSVGGLFQPIGDYLQSAPFYRYAIDSLKREGKFVLKFENLSDYKDGESGNCYRFVIDNLSWTSYEPPVTSVGSNPSSPDKISVTYTSSSDLIHVRTPDEPFMVEIYDTAGQRMMQAGNKSCISIKQFPAGLYLIYVKTATGAASTCKAVKY